MIVIIIMIIIRIIRVIIIGVVVLGLVTSEGNPEPRKGEKGINELPSVSWPRGGTNPPCHRGWRALGSQKPRKKVVKLDSSY